MATQARPRFKVKDLDLAVAGRKEIRLAEQEMPGLMALRARYAKSKPLAGAQIMGSLHMTVQTAVLIETLTAARRRRALGVVQHLLARRTTRPRPWRSVRTARPRIRRASPVFAWKGETLEEYWWCTVEALVWPDGTGPHLIVDDGGDATLLVHKGAEFERRGQGAGLRPGADPEEWGVILERAAPRCSCTSRSAGTRIAAGDPRRLRGDDDRRASPLPDGEGGTLALPRDQRQRLGHQEQVRQHLRLPALVARRADARHRRDARRQGRAWCAASAKWARGARRRCAARAAAS